MPPFYFQASFYTPDTAEEKIKHNWYKPFLSQPALLKFFSENMEKESAQDQSLSQVVLAY